MLPMALFALAWLVVIGFFAFGMIKMVHHVFILGPLRSLFGVILFVAAAACFLMAIEKKREIVDERAIQERDLAQHAAEQRRFEEIARGAHEKSASIPVSAQPTHDSKAAPAVKDAAPGTSPTANSRPDWVNQLPHSELKGGVEVYVAAATAGPYQTNGECDLALLPEIDKAATDFAEKKFPQSADGSVKLDRDFVEKQHVVTDRVYELHDTSYGKWPEEYARLEFNPQVQAVIERQWQSVVVGQRLEVSAIGFGAVLLALGGAYSFLRRKPM